MREAAQLGTGLLIAGHETTANMIGLGVLALLEHPDQLAIIRDTDDPNVIANAVEELLRYLSIIQNGQRRIAIEDIEIGGEVIRAGEGIIIDLAPANWDAKAFPEPDKLDLHRSEPAQLGVRIRPAPVRGAATGARGASDRLLDAVAPDSDTAPRQVPIDEIPFKHDRLAYGVYELPVVW